MAETYNAHVSMESPVTDRPARRRLLPRDATALGAADASLPTDLVERSALRLTRLAWLTCAVVLVETIASHVGPVLSGADYTTGEHLWDAVGSSTMVLLSLAAGYAMSRPSLGQNVRVRLGIVYLIVIAFLMSFTDHADYFWRNGHGLHGVPTLTLLVLAFPVLVPMRPAAALAIGLSMSAMGPLAMLALVATLGYEPPDLGQLSQAFPWIASIVAAYFSHIIHGLGVEVGRARQLGAYDLDDVLGGGGKGEVWRAHHRLLARPAAIKLIRSDIVNAGEGTALERFKREAHTTASLHSPHTVEIYDYGVSDDGRLYYVMELLEGIDLQVLVDTHGPQPAERVAFWMRQVCHSLSEAHAEGLVHRDIKPANVVVGRYGQDYDFVKVVDFGLVTLGRGIDRDDSRLTGEGKIVGTPAFMAPELATSGVVDARSDLYSLGCAAYFMLTGRPVFEGRSPIEVIIGHVDREPASLAEAGASVPAELEQIIQQCLAKEPDQRPSSARLIMERLDTLTFAEPWTPQRAEDWWVTHDAASRPGPEVVDPTAQTQAPRR